MKRLLPERRKEKPQIVVTNLIDVILLLVFFFMITSSFAKDARKVPLELPQAGSATVSEGESLTFQLDREGRVFAAGKGLDLTGIPVTVKEYLGGGRERLIMVEADQSLDYGKVMSVLDVIRSSGGTNIGLATRPIREKK